MISFHLFQTTEHYKKVRSEIFEKMKNAFEEGIKYNKTYRPQLLNSEESENKLKLIHKYKGDGHEFDDFVLKWATRYLKCPIKMYHYLEPHLNDGDDFSKTFIAYKKFSDA